MRGNRPIEFGQTGFLKAVLFIIKYLFAIGTIFRYLSQRFTSIILFFTSSIEGKSCEGRI